MNRQLLWELFREFYRDYRSDGVPSVIAFAEAKWDFSRVCPSGYSALFGNR